MRQKKKDKVPLITGEAWEEKAEKIIRRNFDAWTRHICVILNQWVNNRGEIYHYYFVAKNGGAEGGWGQGGVDGYREAVSGPTARRPFTAEMGMAWE